ncbi:MAG: TIR domain-containing protein [Bacteroidaceae bacterium]|nr:TIR domain-containing protein [Bacteroidaceae bacterium]
MKYDVFISYSRKDTEVADHICKALDKAGITYFIDRQGIGGAYEFPEVLANAIIDSRIFLFLASKHSYVSKFTQAEITFAFNKKERGHILPYVIDGSTMPISLEFVFSAIQCRYIEKDPTNVLIDDLLNILGKQRLTILPKQISNDSHEAVDLGLSVKWATCNVGAASPSDYGEYFAWGETEPKEVYLEKTYKHCTKWLFNKYKDIGKNISGTEYDVARTNWGGNWRLPTMAECRELVDKCTWIWTTQNGHNGYKVVGSNGNSIFLPAAGWRDGTSLDYAGERGYYWSSTPCESNTQGAYYLYFDSSSHDVGCYYRYCGQSVRPVSE